MLIESNLRQSPPYIEPAPACGAVTCANLDNLRRSVSLYSCEVSEFAEGVEMSQTDNMTPEQMYQKIDERIEKM